MTRRSGRGEAVVVGWQIYALTRSTLQLGLVGLMQFLLPRLFPSLRTVQDLSSPEQG